jgi:hypothetical protein
MALILAFRNTSGLTPTSDYEVTVFVNQKQIAGPYIVKEHVRDDGWLELVKKFVREQEQV